MARQRETNYANPIREGCQSHDNGESWTNWWLFSPPLTEEQTKEFMQDADICRYYRGPGQTFTRSGDVEHSRSYTLIKQSGGWDV